MHKLVPHHCHWSKRLRRLLRMHLKKNNRSKSDIISDSCFFEVLNHESENHNRLYQEPTSRGFQMCLRVATRMLHGILPDCVFGATRFHHANTLPEWAVSRGYIADIDNFLFYI
jgi:hypothetical protein